MRGASDQHPVEGFPRPSPIVGGGAFHRRDASPAAAATFRGGCRRQIVNRTAARREATTLNAMPDDPEDYVLEGEEEEEYTARYGLSTPRRPGTEVECFRGEEFCLDSDDEGGARDGVWTTGEKGVDRTGGQVMSSWPQWNNGGATIKGPREYELNNSPGDAISSTPAQRFWIDLERQDSGSGEAAELYSFEDYISPVMSPTEQSEYKCADFIHQSGTTTSYTVRSSRVECFYPAAASRKNVDTTASPVKGVSFLQRTGTENILVTSLESLSLNHKMSYFFNNCTNDGPSASQCSYEEIYSCGSSQRPSPASPYSVRSFDKTLVLDPRSLAVDDSIETGTRKPLYYTTPPLSQIPRRCAIKHKRKLIRSNTLSANSVHKKTVANQESNGQAKDDNKPTDKYNSDGSLATQFDGREWLNAAGIHSSLSLPNRLNEDADEILERFDSEPPGRPTNVTLCVTSGRSFLVSFSPPPNGHSSSEITSYSVEWSQYPGFKPLAGNHFVSDPTECSYEIRDLHSGLPYYVQVRAFNQWGAGPASISSPCYAIPSDWKDIDCVTPRTEGKRQVLDELYAMIRSRLNDPLRTGSQLMKTSPAWKKRVRNTFRSLFSSAPKFQKVAKSGLCLALLISHEDRLLVTNDDVIPIVEIDSEYMPTAANLNADLQWMTKVTCNWYNAKVLRQLLQKIGLLDVSTSPFRRNLLQVVLQLQIVLGIKDLGQFYYQSVRDATTGAVVVTTVCCLSDPKSVNTTYVRWTSLCKLQKRSLDGGAVESSSPSSPVNEEETSSGQQTPLNSVLLKASGDMIEYSAGSNIRLEGGLYLGYLKLGSSLDQILVVVERCQPNVLPNVRIRDNHHVSREEWSLIREAPEVQSSTVKLSDAQEIFRRQLTEACVQLFKKLDMDESRGIKDHRFYHLEVLELCSNVTMIVLLPAPDQICTGPGQRDEIPVNCISIPLHVFEMLNLRTHNLDLIRRYSQLSNFLEIDLRIAQQELRTGISDEDTKAAQGRVDLLTELSQRLEDSWREIRWVADVVTRARDKSVRCGTEVEDLAAVRESTTMSDIGSQLENSTTTRTAAH